MRTAMAMACERLHSRSAFTPSPPTRQTYLVSDMASGETRPMCARATCVTRCAEPASWPPSARRQSGHAAPSCGRPSSLPQRVRGGPAFSPTAAPDVLARTRMPRSVPRAAVLRARRASAWPRASVRLARSSRRPSRCDASPPKPPLRPAPPSSRRSGEPSTSRWRLPAWSSAPHACLRVCDAFPLVRIRPPGWIRLCPGAGPSWHALLSFSPALRLLLFRLRRCHRLRSANLAVLLPHFRQSRGAKRVPGMCAEHGPRRLPGRRMCARRGRSAPSRIRSPVRHGSAWAYSCPLWHRRAGAA